MQSLTQRIKPMFTTSYSRRFARQLLALSALTITLPALAQTAGDYRSAASGNWNDLLTWETYDGANWIAAGATPTAAIANVITVQSPHFVTNTANVSADQVVVAAGGTLIAGVGNFTAAAGADTDLNISGTFLALSGSSALTIASGANVVVQAGGALIHNGTSGACVNNSVGASALQFAAGGKFQLQRVGGTIPPATWSAGSTCEIANAVAGTSRPNATSLGQTFEHFTWNNVLQSGGTDLGGALTNVSGNFLLANAAGQELKWSGDANFGGNLTISNGTLNVTGSTTPARTWNLKGDLYIASGAQLHVSAGNSVSATMIVNGTGTQQYTCDGANIAVKLNWTVDNGSTLNLNSDLPLTAAGRTLTANGIVNVNGKIVSTDLVAGTGTIRNQGGGTGLLEVGAANGNNTLDGTLALLDGTSGSLGLTKRGSGTLTLTAAQTFSGGLVVSNGPVFVENTTGSGTGSGAVTVYDGTLAGNGIVSGAVSVENAADLSPGTSVGKLTINNTLTLAGNTVIEVDKANSTNDVVVATMINYGGTLTVNDLGGGLVAGDSFTIVTAGSHTGDFTSIVGSPGPGLGWQFNPITGVLSVISVVVNPPTLLYSLTGNTLTLSWTEPGYKLIGQTNSLSTGLGANWGDVPGGNTSPVNIEIDPANGAAYFGLAPQ
jgi:fibronectin-binding autotransporter adhesin